MELGRLPPKEFLSLKFSLQQLGFLHKDDADVATAFVRCFAAVLVCPPGNAECRFDSTTESMHLRYYGTDKKLLRNFFTADVIFRQYMYA